MTGERYDPKLTLRYTEIPTFMRAPLADSLDGLDIALVGVPFDGGITVKPGARLGPREVRNASIVTRSIHPTTRVNPYDLCRVADVGDVRVSTIYNLDAAIPEIERFYDKIAAAGVVPLSVGGDHCISFPILKALGRKEPLGLVHIDAHTDTWGGAYGGSRFNNGTPFRLAAEAGVIDPKRTIQIGIRAAQNTDEGWRFSEESGMRIVGMDEVSDLGPARVAEEARRVVGGRPAYLSFDIDALDPSYAPGTGAPEIGGLTTLEAQRILRGLRGLDLVGADLVEVAPPLDPSGLTAITAAQLVFEELCLIAEARVARRR
ncbi:MAG: agmatinase [Alphaproteobacteria bacterium]